MNEILRAYQGDENYVFVSYSHKDKHFTNIGLTGILVTKTKSQEWNFISTMC